MTNLLLCLGQQLRFITELDRLKSVLRQTTIMDESRRIDLGQIPTAPASGFMMRNVRRA